MAIRILVLGGTGFIGPHMVRAALDRGHEVTLFNRGRTNTHLFPQVEKLVGDRGGDLSTLGGRQWDVVIDNSGYFPSHVRASAEALRDSVDHYLFTSTIDAYKDFRSVGLRESYPLHPADPDRPENPSRFYGPLKADCERIVRSIYPDNSTRVRPGWIAGPGDNNHLLTYWVTRIDRGGEVPETTGVRGRSAAISVARAPSPSTAHSRGRTAWRTGRWPTPLDRHSTGTWRPTTPGPKVSVRASPRRESENY